MQLVVLSYWLLLSGILDLIAALVGAVLVYRLARRRLTVPGAVIVAPLGALAGIMAVEGPQLLFAALY